MAIAKQRDKASGESAMAAFVAKWKSKHPKLKVWSEKAEDVLTFYDFPEGLRRLVYTNNRIESFNKQIKRLVKKQIQFVTEEALEKRIVSMFLHYNGEMLEGNRCLLRGEVIRIRMSYRESFTQDSGYSRS